MMPNSSQVDERAALALLVPAAAVMNTFSNLYKTAVTDDSTANTWKRNLFEFYREKENPPCRGNAHR